MIKLKIIIFLVCIIIFPSCNNEVVTLPIKIDSVNKRIYLPITFNGVTSDFLFDTGSAFSFVKEGHSLYSTQGKDIRVIRFNGDTVSKMYQNGHFKLGSLSKVESFILCDAADPNILGMNLISKYYWMFDLEKEIVQISKKPIKYLPNEKLVLDYYMSDYGVMNLRLPIDQDRTLVMMFDTGSWNKPSFLLFHNGDPLRSWDSHGLGIIYKAKSATNAAWMFEELTVDKYRIDYPLFVFDNDLERINKYNGLGYNGLVSIDFIHRYKQFYIDAKSNKIIFHKKNMEKIDEMKFFFEDYMLILNQQRKGKE